jgi:hypothetical protein
MGQQNKRSNSIEDILDEEEPPDPFYGFSLEGVDQHSVRYLHDEVLCHKNTT